MLQLLARTLMRFAVFAALVYAAVDAGTPTTPAAATAAAEQSELPVAVLQQAAAECTVGTFNLYRTFSPSCTPEQIALLKGLSMLLSLVLQLQHHCTVCKALTLCAVYLSLLTQALLSLQLAAHHHHQSGRSCSGVSFRTHVESEFPHLQSHTPYLTTPLQLHCRKLLYSQRRHLHLGALCSPRHSLLGQR
jgi:hypothetical protein